MSYDLVFRYLVAGEEHTEHVQTSAEPVQAVRAFILNNDLASHDWLSCEVYGAQGKHLVSLAYNGQPYK